MTPILLAVALLSQVELYAAPDATIGVAWGNGTAAPTAFYRPLFRELNRQGISVAAATTRNAWSGKEIADAGRVLKERGCHHIIAAGHSQGAGGALRAARDNPELFTAVCPIMPAAKLAAYGKQPCFMIRASRDLRDVLSGSAYIEEKYPGPMLFAERQGITHFSTSDAELLRRVAEFAKTGKATLDPRYWKQL